MFFFRKSIPIIPLRHCSFFVTVSTKRFANSPKVPVSSQSPCRHNNPTLPSLVQMSDSPSLTFLCLSSSYNRFHPFLYLPIQLHSFTILDTSFRVRFVVSSTGTRASCPRGTLPSFVVPLVSTSM